MRRKIVAALLSVLLLICLTACSGGIAKVQNVNSSPASMFVKLEQTSEWCIVYHRDTKVMYAVSYGNYNSGTFTLLVNADGSPMLYEGEK